jgi:hypothetical protein
MKLAYSSVASPRFADAGQTLIDCLVVFPSLGPEPIAYTAAEVDPGAEHSEEIFRRCLAGEFGPVAPPIVEVQPVAAPARAARFDVEATGADDGDEAPARMPKLEPLPIARRASGHKPRKPTAPAKKPPKRKR